MTTAAKKGLVRLKFFLFKQKTAYVSRLSVVGSEMSLRDRGVSENKFELKEIVTDEYMKIVLISRLRQAFGPLTPVEIPVFLVDNVG